METIKPTNVIDKREEHYEIKGEGQDYSLYLINYTSSSFSKKNQIEETLLVKAVYDPSNGKGVGKLKLVDLEAERIGYHTIKKVNVFAQLPTDLTDRIVELPEHVRDLLKRE